MDDQKCERKDRRLLVLLALGAGILSTGWIVPGPESASCYYSQTPSGSQQPPVVIRTTEESVIASEPDVVRLSSETSCADTPPQLAVFFDLPLPINRADENTLTMLSGIGSRLAANIVTFRTEQGKFTGPETFARIDGIGKKMTERLSSLVCFD